MQRFEARRIGATIAALRSSRGMTIKRLEEVAALPCGQLRRIEAGLRTPCEAALTRLAGALCVPTLAIVHLESDCLARSACCKSVDGTSAKSSSVSARVVSE
jgi:transcriptional regulator with XRE-family HTH domain